MAARAFVAAAVLSGFLPVTVREISGVARVAPAPVAVPTWATDTWPRRADGFMSAWFAACSWNAAPETICETARGFVPKPFTSTPPGDVGWPSEISADAL